MADACGIRMTAESWMLYGDLEREWVKTMNEKKPADE